jgi:hypothetical protein
MIASQLRRDSSGRRSPGRTLEDVGKPQHAARADGRAAPHHARCGRHPRPDRTERGGDRSPVRAGRERHPRAPAGRRARRRGGVESPGGGSRTASPVAPPGLPAGGEGREAVWNIRSRQRHAGQALENDIGPGLSTGRPRVPAVGGRPGTGAELRDARPRPHRAAHRRLSSSQG